MNIVSPIKDSMWVEEFINYFKRTNDRNHLLFLMAVYTGFRISDILKLRVRDVEKKMYISITEQKTGKTRKVIIHDRLKRQIDIYIKDKERIDFLFVSRKKNKYGKLKPISRNAVDKILKQAAREIGYDEPVAAHSLRKTFGYRYYKLSGGDIASLMELFNHTSPNITKRYVGLQQEQQDEVVQKF